MWLQYGVEQASNLLSAGVFIWKDCGVYVIERLFLIASSATLKAWPVITVHQAYHNRLKVLPEQPEHLPILGAKAPSTKFTKDYSESVGTTGDSEDGDIEQSEESQEDAEVCRYILHSSSIIHSTYSGVQSNFPNPWRNSAQGRVEIDEKEGQIFASSHCVRHGKVMVWFSPLNCAKFS